MQPPRTDPAYPLWLQGCMDEAEAQLRQRRARPTTVRDFLDYVEAHTDQGTGGTLTDALSGSLALYGGHLRWRDRRRIRVALRRSAYPWSSGLLVSWRRRRWAARWRAARG